MNPFVFDRHIAGETSWSAFRRDTLESLIAATRSVDYAGGFSGPGRVIQVRSERAGMGKSHLVSRLAEVLQEEFEILRIDLFPENLLEWERSLGKRMQLAGEGRRRRFFVLDHLDGFYGDVEAGMRIARLVERFAEAYSRSVVLLSVNRDVWGNVFARRLPSALRDLLSWELQELAPASADEAEGLVIHRLEMAGFEDHVILQFLEMLELEKEYGDASHEGMTPREIFRKARLHWNAFVAQNSEIERTTVPFSVCLTGTEGQSVTSNVGLFSVADQARRHLHSVAEALRNQSSARPGLETTFAPGKLRLLDVSEPNANGSQAGPGDLRLLPEQNLGWGVSLADRFQELRLRFLRQESLNYHPQLMYNLMSRVGARFPSVQQSIANENLPVEKRVLDWTLFGRRMSIAFASGAGEDAGPVWKESEEKGETSKLSAFGESDGEFVERCVDMVELEPDLLASLYAAGELIELCERDVPEWGEMEVMGFLSAELDHFWSRLTRVPKGKRTELNLKVLVPARVASNSR